METENLRVLLIDDDLNGLENSRRKIALYVSATNISTAQNSVDVMRLVNGKPFDLAFIDVELSDTDGFAIADYIAEKQPRTAIVFLTGHTELGAKSYDYAPLDFLCKPVDALRLKKTFERFESSRSPVAHTGKIAVESSGGFVLIMPSDIRYIARENRKVTIYTDKGSTVVKASLEELETIFSDYDLFRVHQSYLVALGRISSVIPAEFGKTYYAILTDGTRIPVSRIQYASLREHLGRIGVQFL